MAQGMKGRPVFAAALHPLFIIRSEDASIKPHAGPFNAACRRAAVLVWLILSAVLMAVTVAPYVLPQSQLAGLLPACESQAADGTPCAFCGMTRGFCAISRGELKQAAAANALSLPLYTGFLLNAAACGLFMARRRRLRTCNS